jgi:hypothetical protein
MYILFCLPILHLVLRYNCQVVVFYAYDVYFYNFIKEKILLFLYKI